MKKTYVIAAFACLVLLTATAFFRLSILQRTSKKSHTTSMFLSNKMQEAVQAHDNSFTHGGLQIDEMNKIENENSKMYSSLGNPDLSKKQSVTSITLLKQDGSVEAMPLEEYVEGCLLGEMPLSFHREALMAQAVAARTFAVRSCLVSSKHKNADVCCDFRCCQSYVNPKSRTLTQQNSQILHDAVNSTKGIIAVYQNEPILAAYHASSGKNTLSSKDVWGGDLPYLVSTPSPDGEIAVSATGNGHRVGMSQHGANILAADGMGFAEILKYYYCGISLGFVS